MTEWFAAVEAPHVVIAGCASDVSGIVRWRKYWPRADYHIFEPVPSLVAMLENSYRGDARVHINAKALTDSASRATFYVNAIPMISSRLPFNRDNPKVAPSWRSETEIAVETTTLDAHCLQHRLNRLGFIELDVQGGELDALRGAEGLLRQGAIDALMVEVFYEELYRGVPLEPAVSGYLASFYYHPRHTLAIPNAAWADIVYLRGV